MAMSITANEDTVLYVVHPLDEAPEEKRCAESLGQIHMSPAVRASLYTLRGYLILIMVFAVYRVLELADLVGHHVVKH